MGSDSTIEISWFGRGGQGAVTASVILAEATSYENLYSQAFPEFGPERRGAPVKAYTRISKTPIRTRSPIINPDIIVVLDPSLPYPQYIKNLKSNGFLIINTKLSAKEILNNLNIPKVAVIDATSIALKTIRAPIVNVAMLGALAKVLRLVSIESIAKATLKILFNIEYEGSLDNIIKTGKIIKTALGNIESLVEAYNLAEVLEV
jgi:pyruvate ferredoxin oxidoreductase gamma subunit